ncbi:YfhO family protein [Metabacillus iocasae]|uniref:Membrane protein YfhO n=1 Tax=Priestia iocasae TaxID=2291674 RepID=A0ABS2QX52_9BACI|nr:YfhO family protein [Metabacillus iocasae]MBM7703997.1 putative membrane protein YfhO [Metabacillus iocasae]
MIHKNKQQLLPFVYFLLMAVGIHIYFFLGDFHFSVTGGDSVDQFLIFHSFLHEQYQNGNLWWSWEYGLGGDIFGPFLYYYSSSLFFWLSVLFPIDSLTDTLYMKLAMSVFKSFLAMSFMYVLLKQLNRSTAASIIGALTYVGSVIFLSFSLYMEFVTDSMVFLPLLILSFEQLVKGKRKWFFYVVMAIIVMMNFYYAYIATVFLIFYAIWRFFFTHQSFRWKAFLSYGFTLSFHYLVGFLLGAWSFLPAVYQFLQADRFQKDLHIPLLFESSFYKDILYGLFFNVTTITFPALTLFLLLIGFFIKERELRLRFLFVVFMFALYSLPFAYSAFNGFSAMQSRWRYLFVFSIALYTPFVIDYLVQKKKSLTVYVIGFLLLIIGFLACMNDYFNQIGENSIRQILLMMTFVTFGCLLLLNRVSSKIAYVLFVSVVSLSVLTNHFIYFKQIGELPGGGSGLIRKGSPIETIDDEEEQKVIEYIKKRDEGLYRVLWHPQANHYQQLNFSQHNKSMLYHYHGFSSYQSLIPENLSSFLKQDYLTLQLDSLSQFSEVNQRLFMETALGAKYYVVPKGVAFQPYGYQPLQQLGRYTIYENQHSVPFGYMMTNYLDSKQFKELNVAERDHMLLQAVVIDESMNALKLNEVDRSEQFVTTLVDSMPKVKLYEVEKATSHQYQVNSEGKLSIPIPPTQTTGEILVELRLTRIDGGEFTIKVGNQSFLKRAVDHIYSVPQETFVINAGIHDRLSSIDVTLTPGRYEIQKLAVYHHDVTHYANRVQELNKQRLDVLDYENNQVKGKIEVIEEGILTTSIPYSKGWHVRVNGQAVEPLEVNHAFVGVPLTKGTHIVEFTYHTPYLREGILLSSMTLAVVLSVHFFIRARRKRRVSF